jgi:hypothetical protein
MPDYSGQYLQSSIGQQLNLRNDNSLSHEKPSKIVGAHVEEGKMSQPEEEERDHRIGSNSLTLRDVVLQGQEGWPDGTEHDPDRIGSVHHLNCKPEDGQNDSGDDGNIGAPETPGSSSEHGEWRMVDDPGRAIESDNEADDEER